MKTALILSGGGARAAYQAGVLKALAEILPEERHHPFPVICGTSAGAINAVVLASHRGPFREATAMLEQLWGDLKPGDIYQHGWPEILKGIGRVGLALFNRGVGLRRPIALLDNAPLLSLIRDTIDFEEIDRNIARGDIHAIGITAMGYSSGQSVCFFQGSPEIKPWRRYRRSGRRTLLNPDHLMASSALPTLFPTTRIEREYYGDGALRQLAPISPALHLGASKVFIIGVSGARDRYLRGWKAPRIRHSPSVAQIIGHLLDSAFIDTLESDIERLERINRLLALIPEERRKAEQVPQRLVENLVISPSQPLDDIAARKVRYLPRPLRLFMKTIGATASGGGAAAASYLLFARDFAEELIRLGYRDTMWNKEQILPFFSLDG